MSTKDWLEKDYYKILGVSKDAKPEEIKKAFRKIARDNHPDQHPGDKVAEERFKAASEANSVLSDPAKRKEYDQQRALFGAGGFRMPPRGGQQPGGFTTGNINVEDLLRNATGGSADLGDLFGGLFNTASTARRTTQRASRRGQDIEGEATIDFKQAIEGTTVSIQTVGDAPCHACHGTGARAGTVPKVCPRCQGSGVLSGSNGGVFGASETCPDCNGRGLIVDDPCPICHGSGREMNKATMQVRVPAGVDDGQKIRIKGKGGAGENGGTAGDLLVLIHVRPDPIYGRSGDNLTLTAPVLFHEAALGGEIEVPTLTGGTVRLRLPAGTPDGRTFRVRGKGVPRKAGVNGDLLVTIQIAVPSHLSPEASKALEAYVVAAQQADPRKALFEVRR